MSLAAALKKQAASRPAQFNAASPDATKFRPSYLFDSRTAADYDAETIRSLGLDGLRELIRGVPSNVKLPQFEDFEQTLFGEAMKDYDRTLHTKEENAKLDSSIALFLRHLSPFFLSKSAAKTIEWLVRRFRVHEFNVDEIAACVLPYHEAKQFVPMVAILKLEPRGRWAFLQAVQKTAVPLDRAHLIQRCRSDKSLLEFIASSVVASAKLGIRNPALDALFAGTAVGVLRSFNAEATVDENTVASMLPSVLDMARIKGSPDVQAASYIVLLQLSSQVELSAEATDGILEVVARHRTKQSGELAVRTILYLCLSQQALTSFSNKTFKQLVVDLEPSELWAAAQAMVGERKDSEAVVAGVCTRFVAFFLDKFLVEPFWNSEEQRGTLVSWLKSDKLPAAAVENFCRSFVRKLGKTMAATDEPVDDADQEDDSAAKLAPFTTIAQTLESHWRSPLHAALDAFNADSSLRQFFQGDVSNEYAVPGSTANLVVDLNSANRASRLGAFTHLFAKLAQGGSEDLVELAKENVLRRLKMDDDKDVLVLILSQDILADLFAKDSEDVTEEMRRLVEESESKKVREAAFKSLVNLEGKGAGEFGKSEAFVLGQCVVSKKNRGVALAFLESLVEATTKSSKWILAALTKGLKPHLDKLKKAGDKDKIPKEAWTTFNGAFITLAAQNLGKRADKLDLGSRMVTVAKDGGAPGLASLLVVSRMLSSADADLAELKVAFAEACADILARNRSFEAPGVWQGGLANEEFLGELAKKEVSGSVLAQAAVSGLASVLASTDKPDRVASWTSEDDSYVGLVRTAFFAAVSGKSLAQYRQIVEALFEKHLDSTASDFLSSLWSAEEPASPLVADRALHMLTAKLASEGSHDASGLVPGVMCLLSDESSKVRSAALGLLDTIGGSLPEGAKPRAKGTIASATLQSFIDDLHKHATEIVADKSHASIYLGTYFNESTADREKVLSWLLGSLHNMPSERVQSGLMRLLDGVKAKNKSAAVGPFLDELVHQPAEASESPKGPLLALLLRAVDADEVNGSHSKLAKLFFDLLSMEGTTLLSSGDKITAQETIMDSLASGAFAELSEERQGDVLSHLLHLAAHAPHRILQHARGCLRALPAVDVSILTNELKSTADALFGGNEQKSKAGAAAGDSRKRARTSTSDFPLSSAARDSQYLIAFLEYLQYGANNETNKDFVVGLFSLLSYLLTANGAEQEQAASEYARQLTIEALKRGLDAHNHGAAPIEDSLLRMDSIVQCLRSSDNPQTHSDVLILLTVIAKTHPELVLHNIMPVFTFMGTNMLRQDDNYSFYVIRETLATLIPRLVDGKNARNRLDAVRQAKPVIQIFVDALQHIPSHRRLNLFVILVESLGADTFLDVVFMRLLEKFVVESAIVPTSVTTPKENMVEFGLALASKFGIETRMNTVVALLSSLEELGDVAAGSKAATNLVSTIVFEPDSHSDKQMRQYRMVVTDFVGRLLSGREVADLLAPESSSSDAAGGLEDRLLAVVELLLRLITQLSTAEAEFESLHLGRFWKALFKLNYTVLGKVNDLLSLPSFLKVVSRLLEHDSIAIRKKIASMFGDKTFPEKWAPSKGTAALFREAFDKVVATVRNSGPAAVNKEDYAALQRLAIKAISSLAEKLHTTHAEFFAEAIPGILGDHALASTDDESATAAMDALASLCQSLGPRALGQLPKFMPVLLSQLSAISSGRQVLAVPALRCTLEVVERFPQFITPYAADLFNTLLGNEFVAAKGMDSKQIAELAEKVRIKLAVAVPARVLVPVFGAQLDKSIGFGRSSVTALFRSLSAAVGAMTGETLEAAYKAVFKVFVRGLDLRRLSASNESWTEQQVDVTESDIVEAFVTVVMKLNEVHFKPVFLKLIEWANPDTTKASESLARGRQLVFYKLLDSLLENLKLLFVPYVLMVIEQMMSILASGVADAASQSGPWIYVVASLTKSFLYDTEGVWKQDSRNEKLMKLLADQLEPKGVTRVATYAERMKAHLVPCLAEYAVSVGTEKNNKALNQAILARCRSGDVEVRLAAVWALQEIWEKAGEDFLPMLPQTVPVVAELLEDDDATVERTARELALRVQDIIGEDLMSYMSK